MSGIPDMTLAQVLYDNALRKGTVSYNGVIIPGFEPVNAYDWRDFSLFRWEPAAGSRVLMVQIDSAILVDSLVFWATAEIPAGLVFGLDWSTDGIGWTPLLSGLTVAGEMQWLDVPTPVTVPATKWLRFYLHNSTGLPIDFRQISFGPKLQFPMGQWNGIAPPKLLHGVVVETVISVNGSILGRNLRRITKEGMLSLNYLTQDWVRNSWNPFAIHASKYAFWWRWNPVTYPTEIALTVADKIEAPKNSSPPGRMEVSMPLLYLS
jgi:hypothetical protein